MLFCCDKCFLTLCEGFEYEQFIYTRETDLYSLSKLSEARLFH